ncbi:unnamed protein product [Ectocarpus sp. CCAP 1310/34]|nr:unnamed protein product [Ectocarpus sp. CCAP 1310/34]
MTASCKVDRTWTPVPPPFAQRVKEIRLQQFAVRWEGAVGEN